MFGDSNWRKGSTQIKIRLNKLWVSLIMPDCALIGVLIYCCINKLYEALIIVIVGIVLNSALLIPWIVIVNKQYKKALEEERKNLLGGD